MRSLLAIHAASLALLGAHPPLVPITSSEAAAAITSQIHQQVPYRLRAGFSGETTCSGRSVEQQQFTASTQLDRWRCTLELRGARFSTPCKAQAYVFATDQSHHVRIEWLAMSRSCHEGGG